MSLIICYKHMQYKQPEIANLIESNCNLIKDINNIIIEYSNCCEICYNKFEKSLELISQETPGHYIILGVIHIPVNYKFNLNKGRA